MESIMKLSISNKTYELLRTEGSYEPGKEWIYTKWHLQTKYGLRKIYPKTSLFMSSILLWIYGFHKHIQKCGKQDDLDQHLRKEKKKSYNDGYNKGVSSVTYDKVDRNTMSSYLDFIVLNEERKAKKLQDESYKKNEEKYNKMIETFA